MRRFFKALGNFIWNGIKVLIILVLLAVLGTGIWFYHEYAKPILSRKGRGASLASQCT